jgi:hypothetical protein
MITTIIFLMKLHYFSDFKLIEVLRKITYFVSSFINDPTGIKISSSNPEEEFFFVINFSIELN